jgi:hypothetical protein
VHAQKEHAQQLRMHGKSSMGISCHVRTSLTQWRG